MYIPSAIPKLKTHRVRLCAFFHITKQRQKAGMHRHFCALSQTFASNTELKSHGKADAYRDFYMYKRGEEGC